MKKSLTWSMSLFLIIAIACSLLVSPTLVSAVVAPEVDMSVVDASGNAVSALYEGTSAYLRVDISGLEQIYNAAVTVNATGAEFGSKENLIKRYSACDALKDANGAQILEINTAMGVDATTSRMYIAFTQNIFATLTQVPPVAVEEFTLVDIPFTVTAGVGEAIGFTFSTGTSDTYIMTTSRPTGKWYIGHSTRDLTVTEYSSTVLEKPAMITDAVIKTPVSETPKGVAFAGFGSNKIVATLNQDKNPADGVMDTKEYDIVTTGAQAGKAYIDVSGINVNVIGTYNLSVVITDSEIGNSPYTKENAVSVVVGAPVATGNITADTTKVVEVAYGTAAEDVKVAVAARTDLFKDVLTDGSEASAEYIVSADNVDTSAYVSTTVGEQTVTVTAVAGATIVNGAVKVKVGAAPVTIDPAYTMSVVDAEGNAVSTLNPGTTAFLRVDVSGLEQIFNAGIEVNAAGAEFGSKENLIKRYSAYDAFKDANGAEILEINTAMGVTGSASNMYIAFTQNIYATLTRVPPVAVEEFTLVDIPFTVTAAAGETVAFTFATGTSDTYIGVANGADGKWYIGSSARPLAVTEYSKTVTAAPVVADVYAITGATLKEAIAELENGAAFVGFEGNAIVATVTKNGTADGTKEYEIVTTEATEGKAYVDISALDTAVAGTYTFDAVITDATIDNSPYTAEDVVSITVKEAPVIPETKTLIKGKVLSTDTTGQVGDFANCIPVGATVTVYPKNGEMMGNILGTAEQFTATAALVDNEGNFEIEVVPGEYVVVISHTKMVFFETDVYASRTVLDNTTNRTITISEGETKDMGTINLRYTYFGDLDFNGTLNKDDYSLFSQNFGSSLN